MTPIRVPAAAALAALALGAPSFAQDAMAEPMMMESGQAMVVMPSGETMMGAMNEDAMTMAMEGAQPVADGTVFFMMDGQMMMATGVMVEDGQVMMTQ